MGNTQNKGKIISIWEISWPRYKSNAFFLQFQILYCHTCIHEANNIHNANHHRLNINTILNPSDQLNFSISTTTVKNKKLKTSYFIWITKATGNPQRFIGSRSDWLQRHDDVIKGKHSARPWLFVWGFHRSPVNSLHKGQWRGALMFSLICAWINGRANDRNVKREMELTNILATVTFSLSGDYQCGMRNAKCKILNEEW